METEEGIGDGELGLGRGRPVEVGPREEGDVVCAVCGDRGRQVGQIHDGLYWEGLVRPEHLLCTHESQAEHRKETPDQVTWWEQTEQGWAPDEKEGSDCESIRWQEDR